MWYMCISLSNSFWKVNNKLYNCPNISVKTTMYTLCCFKNVGVQRTLPMVVKAVCTVKLAAEP
jgi:hypothetical protein